jgi:HlyD family secretion protein
MTEVAQPRPDAAGKSQRSPAPSAAVSKRRLLRPWLITTLLVVAIIGGALIGWQQLHHGSPPRYVTSAASTGPVTKVVSSTGTVNPELTIIVGSYVSGVIKDVHCDYNTQVKTGQVCAEIDPRPYQTAVDQARANLDIAKAQLLKDEASLTYAKATFDRYAILVKSSAVSADAYDNAKSTFEQAQAQVVYDNASIEQRQAALDAAQVNLDYTDIRSPVDGTVVSRNITIGQTVAASFQTPTLFLIASDLTRMQVDTYVSEGDIGGIELGDKAPFSVDAFPSRTFEGKVEQIRQSPQTVQNVVTYDVVVSISNADLALKPGMTASVRVVIDQRTDVLRVPSQAVRYVPSNGPRPDPAHPKVWVLRDGQSVAVDIKPGLNDDDFVEVVSGDIKPGDQVIVAERPAAAVTRPRL